MANKHQRGPSLSSVFREMQIETRGRHHSAPTRAAVREEERKRVWRGRGETAVAGRPGVEGGAGGKPAAAPQKTRPHVPRASRSPLCLGTRRRFGLGHSNSKITNQKHKHQKHGPDRGRERVLAMLGCWARRLGCTPRETQIFCLCARLWTAVHAKAW